MKADNKKIVKRNIIVYCSIISICLSLALFGSLIQIFQYRIIDFGLALTIGSAILKISRLRYFEIDNSGDLISIKCYHPFRRSIIWPVFEMPFTNIKYLQISSRHNNIMIMIQPDHNEKVRTIKYKFMGISDSDIISLNKSFTNSLKKYRSGFLYNRYAAVK
jgi:hypothetical protein